jgi:hypothetical protein
VQLPKVGTVKTVKVLGRGAFAEVYLVRREWYCGRQKSRKNEWVNVCQVHDAHGTAYALKSMRCETSERWEVDATSTVLSRILDLTLPVEIDGYE